MDITTRVQHQLVQMLSEPVLDGRVHEWREFCIPDLCHHDGISSITSNKTHLFLTLRTKGTEKENGETPKHLTTEMIKVSDTAYVARISLRLFRRSINHILSQHQEGDWIGKKDADRLYEATRADVEQNWLLQETERQPSRMPEKAYG